jgi:hypothetical protein
MRLDEPEGFIDASRNLGKNVRSVVVAAFGCDLNRFADECAFPGKRDLLPTQNGRGG